MEVKKESEVEEMDDLVVNKEIGELKQKDVVQEKSMPCTSNFEDHSFYNVVEDDHCNVVGDASTKQKVEEEDEVDILESTGFNGKNEIEVELSNDATDDVCSSSFSGTESETTKALNDDEADSMVCNNDASLPFLVKKKKLTEHWRRFSQPITWRCKWVELKIKELQNQARLYDKEIEESFKAKQLELANLKSEEVGVNALPLSSLSCLTQQKNRVMKRKKRKRVEETSDVQSYTLNHNLFSYNEYRKSFADLALNDNNSSRNLDKKNNKNNTKEETVFCEEETPSLEFREGDAYLETILLKIEAAKSEARNLKNRVDKVINENQSRISSAVNNTSNLQLGSEDNKPTPAQLVIKTEDENIPEEKKPVPEEKKPVKSASVSSHRDTTPPEKEEEDDDETDILLSEILASKRREGKKAIVPDTKLKKTEQTSVEEEAPLRSVRKRTPRNLEMKEETNTNTKKPKVSSSSSTAREKPKPSNVTTSSRFKVPNRKRKRGKRRQGSAGLRRRS